jgi:transposase
MGMWTNDNRTTYERKAARYPSDLVDDEWALVEPHLPPPKKDRRGRPPVDRREILNGILYVLTTGCQWSQLPKDLPPKSTVHDYLVDWNGNGTLRRVHNALYAQAREAAGRTPTPTLAIVDSQSVKSAEKGGAASIPRVMMRARKSRVRSATRPSIHRA